MVLEIGERGTIRRIAEQLDLNPETLRSWVRRAEIDEGLRAGFSFTEREERKETFELRRANEILKAASACFARELDRPQLTWPHDEHHGRLGRC